MADLRDLRKILNDDSFKEWSLIHWNNFATDFNVAKENWDLEENFKSFRTTVEVSDGISTTILHNLNVIPGAHIVLNGVGGIVRAESWTDKKAFITLDSDLYTGKTKTVDIILLR